MLFIISLIDLNTILLELTYAIYSRVNNLFSVDEMASAFNFVQQRPQVVVPVVQSVISELVLGEDDDARHSVYLSI